MITLDTIINGLINLLYLLNVIEGYNQIEKIDEEGTVSVRLDSLQNLFHGSYNDYKINLVIDGQVFIDSDKDKSKIKNLANQVCKKLTESSIKAISSNIVGVLRNNCLYNSDEQTHQFSLNMELYVCNLQFDESSSSSSN